MYNLFSPNHYVHLCVCQRLMLLLQSFNVHAELLLEKQRALSSDQNETSVSIGPVVKCYWRNLLQLSCLQAKEVRKMIRTKHDTLGHRLSNIILAKGSLLAEYQ